MSEASRIPLCDIAISTHIGGRHVGSQRARDAIQHCQRK
jgi:hypothetical protein